MIKVKVTKNIIRDGTLFLNLTLKQILSAIFALLIALGTYFFLARYKIDNDLIMFLLFLEIAIILGFGVIQIQGMSLFKVLILSFKPIDKRPYHRKGVFDNVEKQK